VQMTRHFQARHQKMGLGSALPAALYAAWQSIPNALLIQNLL